MKNIKFTIDLELENLDARIEALIKRSKQELYQEGSGEYGLTCRGAQTILLKTPLIDNDFIGKLFNDYHFVITKKDLHKLRDHIYKQRDGILKLTEPNNLEIDGGYSNDNQMVDDIYYKEYCNYKKEFNNKFAIIEQRINNNFIKYKDQKHYQFLIPLIVSIVALAVSTGVPFIDHYLSNKERTTQKCQTTQVITQTPSRIPIP